MQALINPAKFKNSGTRVSPTIKRFSALTGLLGRVSLKLSISKNPLLGIAKMTKALLSMVGAGMARLYPVPYGILVFSCRFGLFLDYVYC